MTRVEAIDYLDNYRKLYAELAPERFLEALDVLLSESQLHLPSDIAEAAEKNFETMEVLEHENIFEETHNKIFKAGVKWMAEQGQTFEAHVDNGCAIASGVKLPFVLWNTYEDGDVLKVQIRKKQ